MWSHLVTLVQGGEGSVVCPTARQQEPEAGPGVPTTQGHVQAGGACPPVRHRVPGGLPLPSPRLPLTYGLKAVDVHLLRYLYKLLVGTT